MPEQRLLRDRSMVNLAIIALVAVGMLANNYSREIIAFLSGADPSQLALIGPERMEGVIIAMYKLPFGIVFCAALAWFAQKTMRHDAFGTWSRFGILFCLFLYCYSHLAR